MKTGTRHQLITTEMPGLPREGGIININGPSLIKLPESVSRSATHIDPALAGASYFLYFASHIGETIRLAYSKYLLGPYILHQPGVLDLEDTGHNGHIASPDVHIRAESNQFLMYLHGIYVRPDGSRTQCGSWATSDDGLNFTPQPVVDPTNPPYLRVFERDGVYYSMQFGNVARSDSPFGPFVRRATPLFPRPISDSIDFTPRHTANLIRSDVLTLFYSRYGDSPERIMASTIHLSGPWDTWVAGKSDSAPVEVIAPEETFEGVDLPLEPSVLGYAPEPVRQLRDPTIYEEDGRTWLLYSYAGEQGIAITEFIDAHE